MKREWLNPELKNLLLEETKDVETRNFPHYWACKACGKHYASICEPKGACDRCGSTDGYKFTTQKGDAVTLPEFNGNPVTAS